MARRRVPDVAAACAGGCPEGAPARGDAWSTPSSVLITPDRPSTASRFRSPRRCLEEAPAALRRLDGPVARRRHPKPPALPSSTTKGGARASASPVGRAVLSGPRPVRLRNGRLGSLAGYRQGAAVRRRRLAARLRDPAAASNPRRLPARPRLTR